MTALLAGGLIDDSRLILAAYVCSTGLVSALLWRSMTHVFASPVLQRQNYAGRQLAVGSGIVIVLSVLLVNTVSIVVLNATVDDPFDGLGAEVLEGVRTSTHWVVLALGFGLLGLVDDLVGNGDRRGFAGHLGALAHGQVTTGMLKLAGGVLVALHLTWQYEFALSDSLVDPIRQALLVAAAANVGNLFDRAPGRTIKVSVLGLAVVFLVGGWFEGGTGTAMVVAAGLGVLWPDLRERCMLGDTGSNVLGAAVGLGLVAGLDPTGEWIALAVVVALNLLSEKVSFSRVIDATPPLRWFDRLGSLRRTSGA